MLTRYGQHALTWIDLVSPTPAEVKSLIQEFHLDPVLAEELLMPSDKPKVERKGDSLYLVLNFPALRLSGNHTEQEIDFVIGKHYLITARYDNIDPLNAFAKAFEVDTVLGRAHLAHGGHLFAAMARALYGAMDHECDAIQRKLSDIEEHVFKGRERTMVAELSYAGRRIYDFRQALMPHQEMLLSFEPAASRFFGQEFTYYVREILGIYGRVDRTLVHLRDSLGELRATNDSLLNAKQNEIMKTLTVLTFLFLPLTYIASLFAMDTQHNPIIGHPLDFWIILGGMAVVGVACILYFKYKGWL